MSGDSSGMIIGGVLLLGALPMIATAAVAAGGAYAAFKVAELGYHAYKAHQFEASHRASAALQRSTQAMQQQMDRQAAQQQQARARHAEKVKAHSVSLHQMASAPQPDLEAIRLERERLDREMAATALRRERAALRQESERDMAAIIQATEEAAKEREKLVAWSKQDAKSLQQQRQFAEEAVTDGQETLALLKKMDDGKDVMLASGIRALSAQVQRAEQALASGTYQAAAATAQAATGSGLRLAAQHAQKQLDTDALRGDLLARMQALAAELQSCRAFSFHDGCTGTDETVDLADFSQGLWQQAAERVQQAIAFAGDADMAQLDALEQQFSEDVLPSAKRMMESAQEQMTTYYQKLYTAETLIAAMQSNNFTCVEAVQPQDDKTQELALLFKDPSGCQFVISLDADCAQAADVMQLGLHLLPGEGRQPSEQEIACMRQHLIQSMGACGVETELACTGSVNTTTAHPEYADLSCLREQPAQLRAQA